MFPIITVLLNSTADVYLRPSHIRRLSAKYNCPMPAIDTAHQHLLTARALHLRQKNEGHADVAPSLDWSGIVAGTRAAAGLSGFNRAHVSNPWVFTQEQHTEQCTNPQDPTTLIEIEERASSQ